MDKEKLFKLLEERDFLQDTRSKLRISGTGIAMGEYFSFLLLTFFLLTSLRWGEFFLMPFSGVVETLGWIVIGVSFFAGICCLFLSAMVLFDEDFVLHKSFNSYVEKHLSGEELLNLKKILSIKEEDWSWKALKKQINNRIDHIESAIQTESGIKTFYEMIKNDPEMLSSYGIIFKNFLRSYNNKIERQNNRLQEINEEAKRAGFEEIESANNNLDLKIKDD